MMMSSSDPEVLYLQLCVSNFRDVKKYDRLIIKYLIDYADWWWWLDNLVNCDLIYSKINICVCLRYLYVYIKAHTCKCIYYKYL